MPVFGKVELGLSLPTTVTVVCGDGVRLATPVMKKVRTTILFTTGNGSGQILVSGKGDEEFKFLLTVGAKNKLALERLESLINAFSHATKVGKPKLLRIVADGDSRLSVDVSSGVKRGAQPFMAGFSVEKLGGKWVVKLLLTSARGHKFNEGLHFNEAFDKAVFGNGYNVVMELSRKHDLSRAIIHDILTELGSSGKAIVRVNGKEGGRKFSFAKKL